MENDNNQWKWQNNDEDEPKQPRYGQYDPELAAEQNAKWQAAQNQYSTGPNANLNENSQGFNQGAYSSYAASQPGIIPLRPLFLSDIFNAAFSAIRQAPGLMLGVVMSTWSLITILLFIPTANLFSDMFFVLEQAKSPQELLENALEATSSMLFHQIVSAVITSILAAMLTGVCILGIGQLVRGRKPQTSIVLRQLGKRWLSLLGALGLMACAVAFIGIAVYSIFLYFLSFFAQHEDPSNASIFLLLIAVPLFLIFTVTYFYIRFSFTFSAMFLEEIGILDALKRSWHLTRGFFWRIFGITLLVTLLIQIFNTALSGVLVIVNLLITFNGGSLLTTIIVNAVLSFIIEGLFFPFRVGVSSLLYIDARIRREGLAIALQRDAAESNTETNQDEF